MSDLKLHKKGVDHDGVIAGLDRMHGRAEITATGRDALDEDCAVEGQIDENSVAAREFAAFANHDAVGKQQRAIRELHAKLDEQSATLLEKNLRLSEHLRDCRAWLPRPSELKPGAQQQLEALLARLHEVIQ